MRALAHSVCTLCALLLPPLTSSLQAADPCAPFSGTGGTGVTEIKLTALNGNRAPDAQAVSGAPTMWNTCSGVPDFSTSAGSDEVKVKFWSGKNDGTNVSQCGSECGCFKGGSERTIHVFEQNASGSRDCTTTWSNLIAHELGHVLGLSNAESGCSDCRIMGNTACAPEVQADDCQVVDGEWYVPGEDPRPDPCNGSSPGLYGSTIWVAGTTGEPVAFDGHLPIDLERLESREDGKYYMGEWAIVTGARERPVTKLASTEGFGKRAESYARDYAPADGTQGTLLIVEAPDHPYNARYIPTPFFVPIYLQPSGQGQVSPQEFWFRAEVGADRLVDRLWILDPVSWDGTTAVRDAIRENLRLDYLDERRHRVVVFGRGRVQGDGGLTIDTGWVVLPPCHCDIGPCISDPDCPV